MTERIGVCGGCQAKFKIPPTFQGSKAKCNKCGGVVEIGGGEETVVEEATVEDTGSSRRTRGSRAGSRAGGGRGSRAGGGRGSRAGGGRRRGAAAKSDDDGGGRAGRGSRAGRGGGGRGRRGERGEREPKKDNTMLYAGVGGGVVLVGALAFFLLKGDDAPEENVVANAAEESTPADAPVDPTPVEPEATIPEPEADPEPAPEPEPDPEPVPEPSTIDLSNPVVSFDHMPRPPTLSEDEWTELQAAVSKGFLESSRPRDRTAAKKVVADAGPAAVPALINGLNGLDLLDDQQMTNAGGLILAIQDMTHDLVGVPFRLDVLAREENLEHNLDIVNKLLKYWSKYSTDEAFPKFVEKIEKQIEKQAEEVPIEDW